MLVIILLLVLNSNQTTKITTPFTNLTPYKLNNNELSKIEFLDNLKNLKDLDLSCNKIRQID